VADTGLDPKYLLDLLIKTVYRLGLERPSEIGGEIKLPIGIVGQLIEEAQSQKLMQTLGQLGASMTAEMRYALTAKGREWALEALSQSEWIGPAPVSLEAFKRQLRNQSIQNETLTRAQLEAAFSKLTLPENLMDKMGPAVNSGASVLLYGPPGNGKSSIAEAVCAAFEGQVYFPHAVVVDKQIIKVFDMTVHNPTEQAAGAKNALRAGSDYDRRYVACQRPAVITGGELTLDRLDLAYNTVSRVYEAPMQLKAAGGILVVDDFGRQRQSPQELINRLIVPLENRIDYLSLQTGRKFEVPFDSLVMFSTNIPPKKLVDEAALRRLRHKILVDKPDENTFFTIFARAAGQFGLGLDDETRDFIRNELYAREPGAEFHGFQPQFLLDQVRSICIFEGAPLALEPRYLRRAWENLFTRE
jgi:predicted ATPase with chaperone activity